MAQEARRPAQGEAAEAEEDPRPCSVWSSWVCLAFMGPKLWKQLHPPPLPPQRHPRRTDGIRWRLRPPSPHRPWAAPRRRAPRRPTLRRSLRRGGAHRPGRPARIVQPLREQGSVLRSSSATCRALRRRRRPSGGSVGGGSPAQAPAASRQLPRQRSASRERRSSR